MGIVSYSQREKGITSRTRVIEMSPEGFFENKRKNKKSKLRVKPYNT